MPGEERENAARTSAWGATASDREGKTGAAGSLAQAQGRRPLTGPAPAESLSTEAQILHSQE